MPRPEITRRHFKKLCIHLGRQIRKASLSRYPRARSTDDSENSETRSAAAPRLASSRFGRGGFHGARGTLSCSCSNVSELPREPFDENLIELDTQSMREPSELERMGQTLCSSPLLRVRTLTIWHQRSNVTEVSFGLHSDDSLARPQPATIRAASGHSHTNDNGNAHRKGE